MHVCQTLTQPNELGLQTCTSWVEYNVQPKFNAQELSVLGNYILYAVIAAYCFKLLGKLIEKFT